MGAVISGGAELAQLLCDVLPSELLGFCPAVMDRIVEIFRSTFRFKAEKNVTSPSKYRNKQFAHVRSHYAYLSYLKELISSKTFSSDKELAVVCKIKMEIFKAKVLDLFRSLLLCVEAERAVGRLV